jgi:hypothetical protein
VIVVGAQHEGVVEHFVVLDLGRIQPCQLAKAGLEIEFLSLATSCAPSVQMPVDCIGARDSYRIISPQDLAAKLESSI